MIGVTDVITNIEAFVILAIICVVLYYKWKDILYWVTGDDTIHWNIYDTIFCCCFQCCGLHTWEWTRHVSLFCCRCDAGPFATKYAGRNLMRVAGEWLGLVPVQVCIENVVVGDLPTFWTRGRNYIQVEYGDNPAQVSEVVEEGNPKCIRFHTKFQISLLRHNAHRKVRLVVRDLKVFGHQDLCECFIRESDIVDWAGAGMSNPRGPVRIEMTQVEKSSSPIQMPSWIFLEFTLPGYVPPSSRLTGGFSIHLERPDRSRRHADPRKLLNTESLDYESASEFKSQYHLLSAQGGPTKYEDEPDEKLVERLQAFERRQHACMRLLVFLVVSMWGVFFTGNTYVGACSVEYRRVEVLRLHGLEFPVDEAAAARVFDRCGLSDSTLSIVAEMYLRLGASLLHGAEGEAASVRHLSREQAANSSVSSASDSVELAQVPEGGGAACHPTFAEVRKTCYDLPHGQGAITFPAPGLHWVPCDPDLTCREGTLKFAKEFLVASLLVLALLPFMWCAFRAQYRSEEKRIFSASGDKGEAPGCCSCWPTRGSSVAPSNAQSASLGSSASSGASTPPVAQAQGPIFGRSKKGTGGLFSQKASPSFGPRRQRP